MSDYNILLAFLLTTFAGLSTGIGSLIAYFFKKPKMSYLSLGLGLSAGVMIYVSFVELLPLGIEGLGDVWGIIVFFIGILFIMLIDFLVPEVENPHHPVNSEMEQVLVAKTGEFGTQSITTQSLQDKTEKQVATEESKNRLMKTGLMTGVAIAIHNFPEGLAAFGTALGDANLGIVIAIAIAIHNIPEGISVSLPIFYATQDRKKAFWWSFLSGVAEPIGGLLGFLVLRPFLSDGLIGGLLSFIAGIMVYISLDEILPTAHHYGHGHEVVIGVIIGMGVMALSLLLL